MRLPPKVRPSIRIPAVSETDLSRCEIMYVVLAFICRMRKHKDRRLQRFHQKKLNTKNMEVSRKNLIITEIII